MQTINYGPAASLSQTIRSEWMIKGPWQFLYAGCVSDLVSAFLEDQTDELLERLKAKERLHYFEKLHEKLGILGGLLQVSASL